MSRSLAWLTRYLGQRCEQEGLRAVELRDAPGLFDLMRGQRRVAGQLCVEEALAFLDGWAARAHLDPAAAQAGDARL